MTTSVDIVEFPVPTPASGISTGITEGPDGAIWFTEAGGPGTDAIGRITMNGNITQFPVTFNSRPYSITSGPDGALWFTSSNYDNIGRITTAGVVTEYPGVAGGIAMAQDGTLWMTGDIGNGGVYTPSVIQQIIFETATLAVTPASGFVSSSLSFAGSGFAPNEVVQIYKYGVGSEVLASATADSTGAIAVTANAPPSPYLFGNARLFLGLGQVSGKIGAASFSPKARLNPDPKSGPSGASVQVLGSGFGPFQQVRIFWSDPTTLLGTAVADIDGSFDGSSAFQFTVPAGAAAGEHRLSGKNVYGGANGLGTFTVQ
jgi:virginiamycin B lyase